MLLVSYYIALQMIAVIVNLAEKASVQMIITHAVKAVTITLLTLFT